MLFLSFINDIFLCAVVVLGAVSGDSLCAGVMKQKAAPQSQMPVHIHDD